MLAPLNTGAMCDILQISRAPLYSSFRCKQHIYLDGI